MNDPDAVTFTVADGTRIYTRKLNDSEQRWWGRGVFYQHSLGIEWKHYLGWAVQGSKFWVEKHRPPCIQWKFAFCDYRAVQPWTLNLEPISLGINKIKQNKGGLPVFFTGKVSCEVGLQALLCRSKECEKIFLKVEIICPLFSFLGIFRLWEDAARKNKQSKSLAKVLYLHMGTEFAFYSEIVSWYKNLNWMIFPVIASPKGVAISFSERSLRTQ
jgi:hypothetical protein